jgi:hypothetical protein
MQCMKKDAIPFKECKNDVSIQMSDIGNPDEMKPLESNDKNANRDIKMASSSIDLSTCKLAMMNHVENKMHKLY